MIYTYQDFSDAADAVVRGSATDEAYEVLEQWGYGELFPGCIYRKEENMDIETARAVITQAKTDEMYEGPMPEDDDACLAEAQGIVAMAEQAWAQQVRGPEVEAILKLAGSGQNGGSEQKAEEPSGDDDDEQAAEPEDLSGVPETLTKTEPWEGYSEDRVVDITNGINYYIDENPSDLQDLLTHIWAYESSHRRRVRVLKHLKEAFERIGVDGPTEKPAPQEQAPDGGTEERSETSETGDDAPESEGLPADDPGVPQETEAQGEAGDAKDDSISETPSEGDQGGSGEHEAESPAEDRPEGSGSAAYQRLISNTEQELLAERLDIPKPPEEKAPEIPWRWNEVSDSDLRDMLMQFSSLAYYKSYVYSRDERIALHCKEAADEIRNRLMVEISKYDEKGKEKKVGLIEAEIESSEGVRKWRRLQRRHEQYALAAKREMESYQKIYESLSRLETMRHNSWERARR